MSSVKYKALDLMVLLQEGEHEQVMQILKSHQIVAETRDNCGNTLLIWAAKLNAYNVIVELLKYDVYILSPNKFGWTAIGEAAAHGHFKVFLVLVLHLVPSVLESGVTSSSVNLDVMSDLFNNLYEQWLLTATRFNNLQFIKQCFTTIPHSGNIDMVKLLVISAGTGNVDLVNFVLTKETKITDYAHFTHMGVTALMNSCRYGHYEVVVCLLDAGSQVNQVDYWGRTALHEAVMGMFAK